MTDSEYFQESLDAARRQARRGQLAHVCRDLSCDGYYVWIGELPPRKQEIVLVTCYPVSKPK